MGFRIDPDISKAKTIDTAFYTDAGHFNASKEKIFARSWQLVADTGDIPEPGSAFPFTLLPHLLDEPLLLTRDKSGTLRCMSNVCTHRGNILVNEPCRLSGLTCKYHGRRFSLDGKFVSMPEFKEVKDFPTEEDNLHETGLFQWGNLLFTNLHPELKPEDFFSEIMKRVDWFPMEKLRFSRSHSKDYAVKASWALYCENYLEGFHIPFVHAGLNQVLDFGNYTTELFRYSNLQLGIAKDDELAFDLPSSSPDSGKRVAAYYFWVFPNLMLNFYPWGLSVNVVKPVSVSECKVSFLTYILDESKMDSGAGSGLDTVELEDEEIVENVQKGIRSRFYRHGRYSVTREQGTHHFHSLLAEFMNK